MIIFDLFINLVKLLLYLSGMFLRAIALIAIAMGVLWFIGYSFPYVADKLGLPYHTIYEAIVALFGNISNLIRTTQIAG